MRNSDPPCKVIAKVLILRRSRLKSGAGERKKCFTESRPTRHPAMRYAAVGFQCAVWRPTSSMPYTKLTHADALSTNPSQSNGLTLFSLKFGMRREESAIPMIPSGTFRKKIQCHEKYVVIKPPTGGPTTGAISPGQV